MKRADLHASLPPKTLTLRAIADYLQLGSPDAARRWIEAHHVRSFIDALGYRRAWVKDIDAAQLRLTAAAAERIPA